MLCHCGVVHTSANLKELLQGDPAPSKDEKGFEHTVVGTNSLLFVVPVKVCTIGSFLFTFG